jgi:hypothetical protein
LARLKQRVQARMVKTYPSDEDPIMSYNSDEEGSEASGSTPAGSDNEAGAGRKSHHGHYTQLHWGVATRATREEVIFPEDTNNDDSASNVSNIGGTPQTRFDGRDTRCNAPHQASSSTSEQPLRTKASTCGGRRNSAPKQLDAATKRSAKDSAIGGSEDAFATKNKRSAKDSTSGGSANAFATKNRRSAKDSTSGGSVDACATKNTGSAKDSAIGGSANAFATKNKRSAKDSTSGGSADAFVTKNQRVGQGFHQWWVCGCFCDQNCPGNPPPPLRAGEGEG